MTRGSLLAVVLFLGLPVAAQIGPTIGDSVVHSYYSGLHQNTGATRVPLGSHVITVPGASFVRVFFSDVTLGPDDRLEIVGLLDSARQLLGPLDVKKWGKSSAYFNGSDVRVTLWLAPGSSGSYETAWVARGFAVTGQHQSICGSDNRTPSTEAPICRIVTSATSNTGFGTGFLIDSGGCMLTAGHVAAAWGNAPIAEFNVPFSSGTGALNHPSPSDQYPIDVGSLSYVNGAIGNDWAVARVYNDPASSQGFLLRATFLPATGTTLRLTGYGSDSTPNATYNSIQQTDTGPLTNTVAPSELQYRVDTTGGNSGSPIRMNSNNLVVGIHTNGGCTFNGGFNSGTGILNSQLQSAINSVCGGPPTCVPLTLTTNVAQAVSCSPTSFSITPQSNVWNAVGVTSTGDWDIAMGSASSIQGFALCDFVVFDGRASTPSPSSGTLTRLGGVATGDVMNASRSTGSVGSTTTVSWPAGRVLHVVEFNVTTFGNYDVTVSGGFPIGWAAYAAGPTAWRTRAQSVAFGFGGAGTVTVPNLNPGTHAIVLFREGGTGAALPAMTVDIQNGPPVCPSAIVSPNPGYSLDCGMQLTRQWSLSNPGSTSNGSWSVVCSGGTLPASWVSITGGSTGTAVNVQVTVPPCAAPGVYSCSSGVRWTGTCVGVPAVTLTAPLSVTVNSCAATGGPTATPSAYPNPVCAGQPVAISANSTGAANHSWTIPGGSPPITSQQNPTVTFAAPGTYTCTLFMTGLCTGTSSNTAQLTITVGPAMGIVSATPLTGPATGGTFITINGSGFTGATGVRIGGALATNFTVVSNTQITCCSPPSLAGAGIANLAVERLGCAVISSSGFNYTGTTPVISLLTPSNVPPQTQALLLTVDGNGFTPSSVVFADRMPLPTSWVTSTQVFAIVPATNLGSTGGMVIEVADGATGSPVSNPTTLTVGNANNAGTVSVSPLLLAPGALATAALHGLAPGSPFVLAMDPLAPPPIPGMPTPADNYVLAVGSASMFPLLDGLGVFGPANPSIVSDTCGRFSLSANTPNPSAGVTAVMQAAYADPSAAAGFRLSWYYSIGL